MEEYGIPYSEDTKFFKDEELTMEIELGPDQIKEIYKAWGYEMIIRCKDCKHFKKSDKEDSFGWCIRYRSICPKSENGFCDLGELR